MRFIFALLWCVSWALAQTETPADSLGDTTTTVAEDSASILPPAETADSADSTAPELTPLDTDTAVAAATPPAPPQVVQIAVQSHGSWEYGTDLAQMLLPQLNQLPGYQFQLDATGSNAILQITLAPQNLRSQRRSVFFWLGALRYTLQGQVEFKSHAANSGNFPLHNYHTTIAADSLITTGYCGLISCKPQPITVQQRLDVQKALLQQWAEQLYTKLKLLMPPPDRN